MHSHGTPASPPSRLGEVTNVLAECGPGVTP